jgi:hypothetical protein
VTPTVRLLLSAQCHQALSYIVCVRIDSLDLSKEIASSRQFPGPFVEIGQRVPLAQVGDLRSRATEGRFEQHHRPAEVALVSQATRSHEPALCHHLGTGGGLPKLLPDDLGLPITAHGPVTIGYDGVLVVAAR